MLFLSPKAVEYHPRNVYDKLEITSRRELQATIGDSGLGGDPAC
jgi:DNA-binding CsgD family transcriptional regulator